MNDSIAAAPFAGKLRRAPLALKILAGLAALLGVLVLVVVFFPWDVLRGPLNRHISDKTGRHFEITRKLDVKLGRTTRVLADGIEFANPEWAKDPYLVKAESAEIDVRLWPLLTGRIELPMISLHKPELGLQMEADGRRTWALGRDTADASNFPDIGAFIVDDGAMHFIAAAHGADIRTQFTIDPGASAQLPLSYKAKGTWNKEAFNAEGRTGSVLQLGEKLTEPFPLQINASAGNTTLRASGTVASLASLDGADASFNIQGKSLADLYKFLGVVLPETPRYALRGHLSKNGAVWKVAGMNGRLGNSDLSGDMAFDKSGTIGKLTGKIQSKALDFDDLAPLVGMGEQPKAAAVAPPTVAQLAAAQTPGGRIAVARAAREEKRKQPPRDPTRKLLPTAQLDLARLKAMNADVWYTAAKVTNVRQLPLDRMSAHIVMDNGKLNLAPLDLGVAGGSLKGVLLIDGNTNPATVQTQLDARSLELNKLFPTIESTKSSFGKLTGNIDLKGRGNSAAKMLGTASGDVALLMGKGQISNILLEFMGLDGGEIIKFLVRGDQIIELRCAATAFDVKQGVMTSRVLLLDTVDTVINGSGTVSLAGETLDLHLKPKPKDSSILSLRSPLHIAGTFNAPTAGPDKGPLIARAGAALALAAINPLLALAATIETGPGKDADCGAVLQQATAPAQPNRAPAVAVAR